MLPFLADAAGAHSNCAIIPAACLWNFLSSEIRRAGARWILFFSSQDRREGMAMPFAFTYSVWYSADAALSAKMFHEERCLWTAFKSFDVHGDDGKLTKEEIKNIFSKASVHEGWTPEVLDDVVEEVMDRFDQEGVGYLDFEAWLRMMKGAARPDLPERSTLPGKPLLEEQNGSPSRSDRRFWVSL